jgi:phosphatidylserine decarboxylase
MFFIASEGLFYGMIPLVFGIILLFINQGFAGVIFFIFSLFVLLFFRYPDRTAPLNLKRIYAPADGKIVCVRDEFEREFFNTNVKRVSIFMSVFNVHINYSPVNGIVEYIKYTPGKFVNAGVIGGEETNENNFIGISADSLKIGVRQVAGWVARRIVCDCKKGDKLTAGKRFGLIRFGSRVDLFIPKDYTVQIKVGDVVRAGRTVIAEKI